MDSFNKPQMYSLSDQSFVSVNKNDYREIGVNPTVFAEQLPYQPVVNKKQDWVLYGSDNRFPFVLIDLARKGLVHNSLLITKTNMVTGEGFSFAPTELGSEQSILEAKALFERIGINYFKHKQFCADVVLFGGTFPQLVYGRNANGERELKQIIKKRFEQVRVNVPTMETGEYEETSKYHYYHSNWAKGNLTKVKPVSIPTFNDKYHTSNEYDNFSLLVADESPLMEYYPRPDYLTESAMLAIENEKEIMLFDSNDLKKGLTVAGIITIVREDYTNVDEEKEAEIRTKEEAVIKEKMTGASNNGNVIVTRMTPDATGLAAEKGSVFYTPIANNNNADRHKIITERKDVAILSAHGVPMADIAGLPTITKTGLSSQSEMLRMAIQVLYYNRIKPMQMIVEEFYNRILKIHNIQAIAKIQNNLPLVNYISDAMWVSAFTKDEFRQSVNYAPLNEEQRTELLGTITV